MKFGIISFAHMHAYSYARALGEIPGVVLTGIADPDPNRGKAAAEQIRRATTPITGAFDHRYRRGHHLLAQCRSQRACRSRRPSRQHICAKNPFP